MSINLPDPTKSTNMDLEKKQAKNESRQNIELQKKIARNVGANFYLPEMVSWYKIFADIQQFLSNI